MSLRALAQRTGFSPSFLSQVELGQSSPSLSSLQKICDALDIELAELVRDPGRKRSDRIVRKGDREVIRSEWSKANAESLLPNGEDERFSALLITLDPGGRTGTLPVRPGARGFAYCVRGKVLLTFGDERHELSASDSVVLEGSGSAWENLGRGVAEVLVLAVRG